MALSPAPELSAIFYNKLVPIITNTITDGTHIAGLKRGIVYRFKIAPIKYNILKPNQI